jgi:transmembrane sensor
VEGPTFNDDANEVATLVDYIIGEATPQERDVLETRMRSDPALRARLEEMRQLWEHAGSSSAKLDVEAATKSIRSRVAELIGPAPSLAVPSAAMGTNVRPLRRRVPEPAGARWTMTWYRGLIAASILVVAAIALWRSELWQSATQRSVATQPSKTLAEFATGPAQRRTLALSDGTRVTLGPRSVLRAPSNLGAGTRDVQLEGQAYFEVAHDADRPFRVHTPQAVTQVYGVRGARLYRSG